VGAATLAFMVVEQKAELKKGDGNVNVSFPYNPRHQTTANSPENSHFK
jgi:hypothetical protein